MKKWEGIFAALWTPTDPAEQLMVGALKTNLAFLKRQGIHGILALGSTGEFLRLEIAQRKRLVELAIGCTDGLPVIVNVSDIRPSIVSDLARFAKQAGASGIALMAPWFYPLSQADLVEWFVRAAESTDLPFFLYNFPERTGNRIAPETVAAIADRVPLAGIKQSGAEFSYNRVLVKLGQEKNFVVLVGSDTRIGEAMELGASGCIGGLANGIADLMVQIYDAVKRGKPTEAAQASERISVVGKLTDQLEFPLNVAALMEARGLVPGHPKSVVSLETQHRYGRLAEELRANFQSWQLRLVDEVAVHGAASAAS